MGAPTAHLARVSCAGREGGGVTTHPGLPGPVSVRACPPSITISSGPHFFLKCALVWVVNDTVNLNYKFLRGKKST